MTIEKIVDEWKPNWITNPVIIEELKKSLSEFVEKEVETWVKKGLLADDNEIKIVKSALLGTDKKSVK